MKIFVRGEMDLKMHSVLLLAVLLAAMAAEIQDPGERALELDEEEFENSLDAWIEEQQSRLPVPPAQPSGGCTLKINGDLGKPQPVYLRSNWYLSANGNTGQIHLNKGEEVVIACPGTGRSISHRNIAATRAAATAKCVNNNLVTGAGWLNGNVAFGQLSCSAHATPAAQLTTSRCANNKHHVISVGFNINNDFYPLYGSCFDRDRMEVLYVWYDQTSEHAVHQTKVSRPTWQAGNFFGSLDVDNLYKQVNQKAAVTHYLRDASLANRYITKTKQRFLARGHLAAKSDYVFATGQRATFYFINVAPQWQCINAGNWNWLEQHLRTRIGAAGYKTVIHTGTYGVLKLRDASDRLVDIYLDPKGNKIPVPLYFYKVVYDASRGKGTAFVTVNNPHFTLAEARAHEFCTDRCRDNEVFNWLKWKPDNTDYGYSFCCTVDDFRKTVTHLPSFTTNGLLV